MYHNKNLTVLSQKLRKEMTKEEKKLWYQFLRHYPTQFKRQVTCGDYILDFYCPSAKLAIELDGYYHSVTKIAESDKIRTEYLNSRGVQVLRFPNRDDHQLLPREFQCLQHLSIKSRHTSESCL